MSKNDLVPPAEDIHAPVKAFARAGVATIPGLGGFILELTGHHENSIISKRNHTWMSAVYEKLLYLEKRVSSFKVENAVRDEEFCSVVYNARLLAVGTHHEEIRRAARNVVLNHAAGISVDEHRQLRFADFLRRCTTTHLRILSLCKEAENIRSIYGSEMKARAKREFAKYIHMSDPRIDAKFFPWMIAEILGYSELGRLAATGEISLNHADLDIINAIHDELLSDDRLIRDFANLEEWPTKSLLTQDGELFLKYITEPTVLNR